MQCQHLTRHCTVRLVHPRWESIRAHIQIILPVHKDLGPTKSGGRYGCNRMFVPDSFLVDVLVWTR